MNDAIKDRLQKLLALAERGVGGEATNAREALASALRKNGLTIEDMADETRTLHGFVWNGKDERRLLAQIMVTVCGANVELFTSRIEQRKILAKMTQHEMVEIELLWTAHRRQLKKEMDLLYSAYLHRHRLFPRDGKQRDDDLTPEEQQRLKRMAMMMMGMAEVTVRRQLCTG